MRQAWPAVKCSGAAQGARGAIVAEATLAGALPAARVDQALRHLLRRDLIEPVDGGYRLQVELIRRWVIEVGVGGGADD